MDSISIIVQKLNGGGAERAAANLSIALSELYDVHLIVFDGREIKYPYSGTLHDLKMPPNESGIGKLVNVLKRSAAVKKIKKENHIIASISLMDGANLVNVLSRAGDKVFPSIRIQMSKVPKRMRNGKLKASEAWKLRYLAEHSDKIVALSEGVKEDLAMNCGVDRNKICTIYNPCDGEMLKEKTVVHLKDAAIMSSYSITTMGRFTEQKGQWHLIRAMSDVIQKIPDAKLYILGEGPFEQQLRNLAEELNLKDNIIFLGFVEAPHAYIMKSRVFVFPSLYEGLGNVLLEAMSCGTPCIAADCESGPREILAPGTGLPKELDSVEYAEYGVLTTVGDKGHFNAEEPLTAAEQQLAEAMIEMLTNPALLEKYKKQALMRVNDFSPERIAEQWASLIE